MFDEPVLANDALLADVEVADPCDGLVLWWLGRSGFLVKSSVGCVLFAPCTDESRIGVTRQAIAPGQLKSIDVVTLSQVNSEFPDARELKQVFDANPKAVLLVPEVSRKSVAELLECDAAWPWGLNDGESVSFGELTVLALETVRYLANRDTSGRGNPLGYIVWFGDMKVYFGSLAKLGLELIERLRPLEINIAILAISTSRSECGGVSNLFDDKAAELVNQIGAQLVVPHCYDMVDADGRSPELVKACERLGQPCKALRLGERLWVQRSQTKYATPGGAGG